MHHFVTDSNISRIRFKMVNWKDWIKSLDRLKSRKHVRDTKRGIKTNSCFEHYRSGFDLDSAVIQTQKK
jgi:hypothetical protein